MTFEEQLKEIMEKKGIRLPTEALEQIYAAVTQWLTYHEKEYRAAGAIDEAEAIRDLHQNLLREDL